MTISELRKRNGERTDVLVLANEEITSERIEKKLEEGCELVRYATLADWCSNNADNMSDGEVLDMVIEIADKGMTEYYYYG